MAEEFSNTRCDDCSAKTAECVCWKKLAKLGGNGGAARACGKKEDENGGVGSAGTLAKTHNGYLIGY